MGPQSSVFQKEILHKSKCQKHKMYCVDSYNLVHFNRAFTVKTSDSCTCISPGSTSLFLHDSGRPVGWVKAGNTCQQPCLTGSQSQNNLQVTKDTRKKKGGLLFPQCRNQKRKVDCNQKCESEC